MRPTDFAGQLNVSVANGWGIIRTITDICMKMPEGKYVLVKDPNKASADQLGEFCGADTSSLVCNTAVLRSHDGVCDGRRGG